MKKNHKIIPKKNSITKKLLVTTLWTTALINSYKSQCKRKSNWTTKKQAPICRQHNYRLTTNYYWKQKRKKSSSRRTTNESNKNIQFTTRA